MLTGLKDLAPNTPDDEVAVVEVNAEGLTAVETVEVKEEDLEAAVDAVDAVVEEKADERVAAPAGEDGCAEVLKADGLAAVSVAVDETDALGVVPKAEGLAMDDPAAENVKALEGAGET